jgi:hypothetical protein
VVAQAKNRSLDSPPHHAKKRVAGTSFAAKRGSARDDKKLFAVYLIAVLSEAR